MCELMAEEVLEKYQMAEVKKGAYKGNKLEAKNEDHGPHEQEGEG